MTGRRGFTLVEIMIALGVSALALTAAVTAANAQARAFYNGQKSRAAQDAARSALLFVEQKLPRAGFGMDASLALDFGWYDRAPICPVVDAEGEADCVPDRTDGADELVFYARDPAYWVPPEPEEEPRGRAWHLVAISAEEVKVKARANDVFRMGQILQAVCPGQPAWAYFTVSENATAAEDAPEFAIRLADMDVTDPFKRQDVAAAMACFGAGVTTRARVFLVDRFRFHVRPVDTGDGQTNPFLVLDTGTDLDGDDDVDADDEILLAEGIEGFQVAYEFANPALGAASGVTATTFPGTVAAGQFEYEPSSFYRHRLLPPLPAERLTTHQANVRAVRVAVVARSPEPDPVAKSNLTWTAGSPLWRLNQTAVPDWVPVPDDDGLERVDGVLLVGGYQRTVVDTVVTLPNMTVRAMSYF